MIEKTSLSEGPREEPMEAATYTGGLSLRHDKALWNFQQLELSVENLHKTVPFNTLFVQGGRYHEVQPFPKGRNAVDDCRESNKHLHCFNQISSAPIKKHSSTFFFFVNNSNGIHWVPYTKGERKIDGS